MPQNKKNLHERFHRAVNYEKVGDHARALTEYVDIIREDKNFREAYINLGSLYSRMNKLEKAMNSDYKGTKKHRLKRARDPDLEWLEQVLKIEHEEISRHKARANVIIAPPPEDLDDGT